MLQLLVPCEREIHCPPEPYGQIGFLDFTINERHKLGVEENGVAVDRRLADKSLAPTIACGR